MSAIFDQMLSKYEIKTTDDEQNALHEVMQQIALSSLYRSGFYDKAAFYGGTCLRIFHNLPRFSEDMDFSLVKKDPDFKLEEYFDGIVKEFKALGRSVNIVRKEKSKKSAIESAFLKDTTEIYNLSFQTEKSVKIKIEVDTDPPLVFDTEYNLLLQPFSFMTRCFTLQCLFAGKVHAFLFRNWNNRVKGRDWYDLEWYIRNEHKLDLKHFEERARQSGHIETVNISVDEVKTLLKERINKTKIEMVVDDVKPFVKETSELEIWTTDYFLKLVNLMKYE